MQNFTNAILYGERLIAPGLEGIYGLTISNAAYMSDWLDRWIEFPMDEDLYSQMLKEMQLKEETLNKGNSNDQPDGEYNQRWKVRW